MAIEAVNHNSRSAIVVGWAPKSEWSYRCSEDRFLKYGKVVHLHEGPLQFQAVKKLLQLRASLIGDVRGAVQMSYQGVRKIQGGSNQHSVSTLALGSISGAAIGDQGDLAGCPPVTGRRCNCVCASPQSENAGQSSEYFVMRRPARNTSDVSRTSKAENTCQQQRERAPPAFAATPANGPS